MNEGIEPASAPAGSATAERDARPRPPRGHRSTSPAPRPSSAPAPIPAEGQAARPRTEDRRSPSRPAWVALPEADCTDSNETSKDLQPWLENPFNVVAAAGGQCAALQVPDYAAMPWYATVKQARAERVLKPERRCNASWPSSQFACLTLAWGLSQLNFGNEASTARQTALRRISRMSSRWTGIEWHSCDDEPRTAICFPSGRRSETR